MFMVFFGSLADILNLLLLKQKGSWKEHCLNNEVPLG